jgi:hypothetical protein
MGLLTAGIMWEVIQARIEGRPASLLKVRQLICERDEWEEVPPIKQGRTLVPQPPKQVKGLKINCDLMAREGGEQIAGLISRFLREYGQNELSGIQSTFDTQTQWLISKPISRDLEKGNWSFAQLRETPTTVYILLPPEEIEDKRRWTRLLITCALNEHLKAGPVGTLFILDEFRVAVAHLEIINTFWSLVRGYGVQFLVVCQSALHLKALFKDEWEIYAGQAGAVVTLGPPADSRSYEEIDLCYPPVADLGRCVASGYYDFHACATQPSAARHEGLRQVITTVSQNYTQFPTGRPIFLPHPRQVAEIPRMEHNLSITLKIVLYLLDDAEFERYVIRVAAYGVA